MSDKDAATERGRIPTRKKPENESNSAAEERWSRSDNWVGQYRMVTDKHGIEHRRLMKAENTYPEERVWVLPVYSDDSDSDLSPMSHQSEHAQLSCEGSDHDDPDKDSSLSQGDAAEDDSEEETSSRVMRKREEKNYEPVDPDELQDDDQNKLAVALQLLKKQCWSMGKGLSEADMHAKVMRHLLGVSMIMAIRPTPGMGQGGFTVRAVKTGDVLAVLTSETESKCLRGDDFQRFEKMKWGTRGMFQGGFINSCCAIHRRVKSRKQRIIQERNCKGNAEYRVIEAYFLGGIVKIVVVLAKTDIAGGEQIFAYYPVDLETQGGGKDGKDGKDGDDSEEDEDAEEDEPTRDSTAKGKAERKRGREEGGGSSSKAARKPQREQGGGGGEGARYTTPSRTRGRGGGRTKPLQSRDPKQHARWQDDPRANSAATPIYSLAAHLCEAAGGARAGGAHEPEGDVPELEEEVAETMENFAQEANYHHNSGAASEKVAKTQHDFENNPKHPFNTGVYDDEFMYW